VGAPHDANSSFMRGAAAAPDVIRRVLHNGAANLTSESGLDLSAPAKLTDVGNLVLGDGREGVLDITAALMPVIEAGRLPLLLGGDHAITFPALRAIVAHHGPVDILHFDAHADIYEDFEHNPLSHASPFARIMESGLARRLVQVGIRTLNAHQRDMISRYGVEVYEYKDFDAHRFQPRFGGKLYVSFDVDALDPGCAPGVSHHEPGGMSVREAVNIIQRIEGQIVGADIVEFNPARDAQDLTAAVCAKLAKELAARMIETQ
jgi:agmatinase